MIIYLGNMLSKHGGSVSVIETLAPKLAGHFKIKAYSSQKSQVLRLMEMLWAILRNLPKIKIVLIDSYSSPKAFSYCLVISQLCRILDLPYLPILHGGDFPYRLETWPRLSKLVFSNATLNLAPSGYLQAAFERKGFKTNLIPNAIEIEKYPFKQRKTIRPRLLWVRAFDKTYNPQLAIHVINKIANEYQEVELLMVGADKDGSMAECITLANQLGLSDKVHFSGKLEKAEWIERSKDFDIFINTTNFDNTPVSVIEAMALGLPIISTDVGGIPFLITDGENGLLAPANKIEEFTLQILKLLKDNDLAESLSSNGRTKAESFSWERVKPLWLKTLRTYS